MKKHPYLLWQLIGWGIMLADLIYMIITVENDIEINYPFLVFTAIGASFVIMISPIIIFSKRRAKNYPEKNRINNLIIGIHSKVETFIVMFLLIALSLSILIVVCYWGLPILAPLAFVVSVVLYSLWVKSIRKRFFIVKDGAEKCRIINTDDSAVIDTLFENSALFFIGNPTNETLNFIYNALCKFGSVNGENIDIYAVKSESFAEKYNISLPSGHMALCIIADEELKKSPQIKRIFYRVEAVTTEFPPNIFYLNALPKCCMAKWQTLAAFKEENGGLFLLCENCGSSFDTLEDAEKGLVSSKKHEFYSPATIEEIREAGWYHKASSYDEDGRKIKTEKLEGGIPAADVDDKIHKKMLSKLGFFRFGIGITCLLTVLFGVAFCLGIFNEYHMLLKNIWAAILVGGGFLLCGLNAFWQLKSYIKIAKKHYLFYLCKVKEVISNQQLFVDEPLYKEAFYDETDLPNLSKTRFPDDETLVYVAEFENKWYAFNADYN